MDLAQSQPHVDAGDHEGASPGHLLKECPPGLAFSLKGVDNRNKIQKGVDRGVDRFAELAISLFELCH